MLGTMLRGRYKIVRKLGQGGFGETYLAEDMDLPRNPYCVVKQFKPQLTNPQALQQAMRLFDTEADVLYRLGNHEQIPRLLAHFEENQEFYLVQEYVQGDDLSTELKPGQQWNQEKVIAFLRDILKILEFVHQQNVIHRDIKPANLIRRAADGKLFLIDFGAVKEISTLMANNQGRTVAVGTPGYMPSEQYNGQPQLCSDIYAVGMIGIQALTGILPLKLPIDPKTLEFIWRNQVQVNPQLADILDRMVRYHFGQRYQSAPTALQALTNLTINNKQWSKTKKTALTLTVLTIIFSMTVLVIPKLQQIFSSTSQEPSLVTNSLIYENLTYGIKIKYPKTWSIKEIEQYNTTTTDVARFLSPQKNVEKPYQSNLTVEIEDLKEPILLDEYTSSRVNEITQFLADAKIDKSRLTQLANRPAHEVVYSGKEDKYTVKRKAVWTLSNNKAYIITYAAEESQYDDLLKIAEQMIDSLEIN
ncbi:protein kinase domain-containing protein [Nostoc sp. ChiSLP03a]|uniref:protein kinase domain-containing protein n=1 Tax=Nostoc sp. ChiSLP03a TaxID=3075380 RepID=UPI002AD3E6A6|nr:protein kinase [Nostoc sp. ChiSLP03a]MDZ8212001.1 protein kinase [Nostoc sp. ChiSLP03a]